MILTIIMLAMVMTYSSNSYAQIKSETVTYTSGADSLQGLLVYDESTSQRRPGILVVHEWYGLNDYPRMRAEQLAKLGYVAFAVDMYGKRMVAKTNEEAGKLAGVLRNDRNLVRTRISSALEILKNNRMVDIDRISAIGYCFGGMVVLELARSGADIKGVVGFHTSLDSPSPAFAGSIKAKILVLQGANDPNVPMEQEIAFRKEMTDAKADWQMNLYGGAVHSFTNPAAGNDPTKGAAYNENADKRSWEAMMVFFEEIFK